MKKISFVIPCYRSENTIKGVVKEIGEVVETHQEYEYEIILVNDCSPDGVWKVIKELSNIDAHIKGIDLTRNFGQHCALMAGYGKATGDLIVSLDDDGQTPIDELFTLINKIDEGYDVCYAYYKAIQQKFYRRLGSKVAHKMDEMLIGLPSDVFGSSYYVMRSYVKDEMLCYRNTYPYLLGLVCRVTKNIASVPTNHRARREGTSGYSLMKLFSLWFNGVSTFSVRPLEVSAYVGTGMAIIGFLYAFIIIIRKLIGSISITGWSTITALMLILGGGILLTLGLIGEYVGRIYMSINNAPQYVIRETTEDES